MTVRTALDKPKVCRPPAYPEAMAHKCEFILNIGLFFDGTGNNWYEDAVSQGHTNVARLWRAYKDDDMEGFFKHYVPGVGTPFKDIGEEGRSKRGLAMGWGGEARIVWGLLQVLNSTHMFLKSGKSMFDRPQMLALCSNTVVPHNPELDASRYNEVQTTLNNLGLSAGLVDHWAARHAFIAESAGKLTMLHHDPKTSIRLVGIHLDVFGFSRGAAQARVFCNWLQEGLLIDGKMFGVPAQVRMLGLFDTVASVGPLSSGHGDWSSSENLRIPPESVVKNCVHFVALHELRKNFPLESVRVNGQLPSNCSEHVYPGSHSNVGGGYQPGEQGKAIGVMRGDGRSVRADHLKLSQVPLNDMLQAARKTVPINAADDPWMEFDTELGKANNLTKEFASTRYTQEEVAQYFELINIDPNLPFIEMIQAHSVAYLAWRYRLMLNKRFHTLMSVKDAAQFDPQGLEYCKKGQALLEDQCKELGRWFPEDTRRLHPKAGEIYKAMQKITPSGVEHGFFDAWVHDSHASFWAQVGGWYKLVEPEGYVRHRGIYMGEDTRVATLYFDTNELNNISGEGSSYA